MTRFFPALGRMMLGLLLLGGLGGAVPAGLGASAPAGSYLVQAGSTEAAAAAVGQVGGGVTARLGIIDGVAATLDGAAVARLRATPGIRVQADGPVLKADADSREVDTRGLLLFPAAATHVNQLQNIPVRGPQTTCANGQVHVSATQQETRPLQGWGVTVAVIDSGLLPMRTPPGWTSTDSATGTLSIEYAGRCLVYRDFLPRTAANGNSGAAAGNSIDQNGHGTHVISTIADNRWARLSALLPPSPIGVAPQVNLLVARALDKTGAGTYAQVIAAIDWIVANKARYNVRVLNLSLYAPIAGPYWADPLNQAVMRAWQAGIVVVAAAGNNGPGAGTITVPGNVPYVVTVGAVKSGRYTTSGYDELAFYSSRGPTESAFVKPDVLVPASRTIAPLPAGALLTGEMPAARLQAAAQVNYGLSQPRDNQSYYYQLSGTSMAAAEVSGIAALTLQVHPQLTNDQVKYRLMATARTAIDAATGHALYSVWEQGAGWVDAPRAILAGPAGRANTGLDLDLDLTSTTHYWGYTTWDPATSMFGLADGAGATAWGGGTTAWAGGTTAWAGGTTAWAGGTTAWAGGTTAWAGTTMAWAGGTTAWAGNLALWAGGTTAWAGTTGAASLNSASTDGVELGDP
jgi:subtilisin family serine protease